jgi:hypothetical protein
LIRTETRTPGMSWIPQVVVPAILVAAWVQLFRRRHRERAGNAPLRGEIKSQVVFETTLHRASVRGTGGFGGRPGSWYPLRGPKRLIVGTDAFMVSAPQALREFAFAGRESTISYTPIRYHLETRDSIVTTGPTGGSQVQLAITGDNLMAAWQALEATGAAIDVMSQVPGSQP